MGFDDLEWMRANPTPTRRRVERQMARMEQADREGTEEQPEPTTTETEGGDQ